MHALAIGAEVTDDPIRATALHAVPAALPALLDGLPHDAPLRLAVVAGSTVPASVARSVAARGVDLVEYYGAAELSLVAVARRPDGLRAFPGVEIDVRHGEIWVRSPFLALGYLGGTDGPFRRDGDGFATVGDRGAVTQSGDLIVRGRGDGAINVGGITVLAEDVEDVLGGITGVRAVAVVAAPSDRLGAVLVAVIEPDPAADPAGIRRAARRLLRAESLPRRWLLTDRLPRTPSGKVARADVAAAVARHLRGEGPGQHAGDPEQRLRPIP